MFLVLLGVVILFDGCSLWGPFTGIWQPCMEYFIPQTKTARQGRGSYLASIVIPLEIAKAGRQVPKPRCLSHNYYCHLHAFLSMVSSAWFPRHGFITAGFPQHGCHGMVSSAWLPQHGFLSKCIHCRSCSAEGLLQRPETSHWNRMNTWKQTKLCENLWDIWESIAGNNNCIFPKQRRHVKVGVLTSFHK